MLATLDDYQNFVEKLPLLDEAEKWNVLRHMARTDLFFLLWFVLRVNAIFHPWLLARCKEVQAAPNDHLDLWAREHFKSTIITLGKSVQDIIASHGEGAIMPRECTIGIFSFTRPIAKGFLRQIKQHFEANELLRSLFPDIFWENPNKEAPKWSEDDGIILKRKSTPKESTVEAWGVVDSQPTGKHFTCCVYDDVVTEGNVRSPGMIQRTTESWELSVNLCSDGGSMRYIGTRYHFNDTYKAMMERGAATPRIYPATDDGTADGNPVFMSQEYFEKKKILMGSYTFSCQMLINPISDSAFKFYLEHLQYHNLQDAAGMNVYITVDPAHSKKDTSDFTVMWVIGLNSDNNYYVLDIVRDKMSLSERTNMLFELHRRWRPLAVGYERYGAQSDIQHIEEKMRDFNYHFGITELGGKISKFERIKKLNPILEARRLFLPINVVRTNYEHRHVDLVNAFINEEYLQFPVAEHDDMLDSLARILDDDLGATFPMIDIDDEPKRYMPRRHSGASSVWAA